MFSCKRVQGFTRKARLRNAFYDSYQSLYNHIVEYNQNLEEFCLKHATIREQINLFYKKNDFTGMMQFLTNLDCCRDQTEKAMAPSTGSYESLEKKMRISAPPPVDQFLPEIPAIPQFRQIKNKLKSLIDESHAAHPELDPRHFCR